MKSWLLAIRPKTLVAAVVPVVVGTALVGATSGYVINWFLSFCALGSLLFIQIGTNLINDALDFKKGVDTTERLGPVRVTQSGLLTLNQVLFGGFFCFFVASLFGLPLVLAGGWTVLIIGILSLLCGYLYTGGPYPFAYLGLGDPLVIVFFGLVAVGGVFYVETGTWNLDAAIAGLQCGLLATTLIAVNNFRDVEQDRKANKKTLAVRFGYNFARTEILFTTSLPFLLNGYWWWQGYTWAVVLPLIALPFAYQVVHGVYTNRPSPIYNYFLARAALTQLNFGGMLAVGFFWS